MSGNKSPRSPTQHAEPDLTPTQLPPPAARDAISTPEIQNWLTTIELCLNEISAVAGESKMNTEQKLRISNTCRTLLGGVSKMAVQYQSIKQKYFTASTLIETLSNQVEISAQLKDLKETVQSPPTVSSPLSFADMVRSGGQPIVRPPNTNSITIFPTDKHATSDDTKNLVQNLIKPEALKLHIRGMRKTKNGGIIISSERKDDIEKLKKSEQLTTSGLKVEETSKKLPKVIVLGIPSTITEKEFFECLFEQNIADKDCSLSKDQFDSSVKLSHKSGKKEASTCNFILELTPTLRKLLINQQRIFIHWTSCPVRDYTIVTRCYKCHQYGHSAKYCRDPDSTCGHCSGKGHSIKECPNQSEPPKCATCIKYKKPSSHKTGDEQCPARKIAVARHISIIDYEGA